MQQRKMPPTITTPNPPPLPAETPSTIAPSVSGQMPPSWPQLGLPPSCSTPPPVTICLPPPNPRPLRRRPRQRPPHSPNDLRRLPPRSRSMTPSIIPHRNDSPRQMSSSPGFLRNPGACLPSHRGHPSGRISRASTPPRSNGARGHRWIPVAGRAHQEPLSVAKNNVQWLHCPLASARRHCASLAVVVLVVVAPAVFCGHVRREAQWHRPQLLPGPRPFRPCLRY